MILKEREIIKESCSTNFQSDSIRIVEEIHGCDFCGLPYDDLLQMLVFYDGEQTEWEEFCCWECLINSLLTHKDFKFISLPILTHNSENESDLANFLSLW